MCRDTAGNDCDLPEYCNGNDDFCPADIYKRDGTNCTVNGVRFWLILTLHILSVITVAVGLAESSSEPRMLTNSRPTISFLHSSVHLYLFDSGKSLYVQNNTYAVKR